MTDDYARGRTTLYKGIRMRSRLEASYAAWLDGNGWAWTYEPQCFADETGQYLPDFRLDNYNAYHEVKPPTADTAEALRRMHIIRASEPGAYLWVVVPTGNYPNQGWAPAGKCSYAHPCGPCRGNSFHDHRTIAGADRTLAPATGGKCSPEETAAFLADRPWP